MASLTLDAFKTWCALPAHQALALALVAARAIAQAERARVDAYIVPLLLSFDFRYIEGTRRAGQTIDRTGDLYLTDEDDRVKAFYTACDALHRAHGFVGPAGHCPALVAENAVIRAETALIQAAQPLTGISCDLLSIGPDGTRTRYLQLLLQGCLAENQKGGR